MTVLITAAQLAAGLSTTAVLDCRHDLTDPAAGRRAFAAARIPGAHHLHLDDDLSGKTDGKNGRHPLPPPRPLMIKLRARGALADKCVVCCDDLSGPFAARLWWLLRRLGFHRVKILDGGFQAWQAAGLPIAAGDPFASVSTVAESASAAQPSIAVESATATIAEVADASASGTPPLIDARRPERYRGEVEPLDPRPGHIPAARNRCYEDNLTSDGFFKPPEELRQEFAAILLPESAPPIHYCGSGVTACHNIAAMTIAGLPPGKLYPGSWSEWCADPSRPAACGQPIA